MLSFNDDKLIAYGKNQNTKKYFKLYYSDEDGDPQINVQYSFILFNKAEIHAFLYDYSITLEEFKKLFEMAKNDQPPCKFRPCVT